MFKSYHILKRRQKTPGGRRLLKGAGIYYQLTGLIGTALLSLVFLISLFLTIVIPSELGLEGVILLFVAIIGLIFFGAFLLFGNIAERNCGATEKSAQLVNNGKILLVTAVIFDIVVTLYMIFNAGASVGHFNYSFRFLCRLLSFSPVICRQFCILSVRRVICHESTF